MSSSSVTPTHVLTGEIKAETARALLIHCSGIDGNDWEPEQLRTHWIPYSQILKIDKPGPDSDLSDSVTVKRWILQQKGIV